MNADTSGEAHHDHHPGGGSGGRTDPLTDRARHRRERKKGVEPRRVAAGLETGGWGSVDPAGSGGTGGNLVGLALSGGGLRSAMFQLGVLEEFARRNLLKYVDYCSSVSGGGFSAGYLAALGDHLRRDADPKGLTGEGKGDGGGVNAHKIPDLHQRPGPAAAGGAGVDGADPMAHAGGYLKNVPGLLGRWLLGTLPVLLMFFCGLAAVTAAASLVWRGADTAWFRDRANAAGAWDFGGEVGYAVLPLVVLCFGWLPVQFAAGRRSVWGAVGWLAGVPWFVGTVLAATLLRFDEKEVGAAWLWGFVAAVVLPAVSFAAWRVREWGGSEKLRKVAGTAMWMIGGAGALVLGLFLLGPEGLNAWGIGPTWDPLAGWEDPAWFRDWSVSPQAVAAIAVALGLAQLMPALALPKLAGAGPADPTEARRPVARLHGSARRATLALLFAAVVSGAVFFGNGISSVGRSSTLDEAPRWESWAGYLGLAAGAIQLAAVLGFDSLFRSDQAKAPTWQRAAFRLTLSAVLGLPVLALLSGLAGEDISGFTRERGPELTVGDVLSPPALAGALKDVELPQLDRLAEERAEAASKAPPGTAEVAPDPDSMEVLRGQLLPFVWAFLKRRPDSPNVADGLSEAARLEAISDHRLRGAPGRERRLTDPVVFFWDRPRTVLFGRVPAGGSQNLQQECCASGGTVASAPDAWRHLLCRGEQMREARLEVVKLLNEMMSDAVIGRALARDLIRLVRRRAERMDVEDRQKLSELESTQAVKDGGAGVERRSLWERITSWGSSREKTKGRWPDTDRQAAAEAWVMEQAAAWGGSAGDNLRTLWRRATHHGLNDHAPGDDPDHLTLENFRPDESHRLNRLLLAALFPAAIRQPNDPSTHLVAYADQRFRFAVLLTAGGAFLFLLLGWVDFNRHNPSYEFYRNGIARHFLGPAALSAAGASGKEGRGEGRGPGPAAAHIGAVAGRPAVPAVRRHDDRPPRPRRPRRRRARRGNPRRGRPRPGAAGRRARPVRALPAALRRPGGGVRGDRHLRRRHAPRRGRGHDPRVGGQPVLQRPPVAGLVHDGVQSAAGGVAAAAGDLERE